MNLVIDNLNDKWFFFGRVQKPWVPRREVGEGGDVSEGVVKGRAKAGGL